METVILVFLLLALLGGVAWFVARPFIEPRRVVSVTEQERKLSALVAEREQIVTVLQELDFDNAMEKIPSEDYPAQRVALLQRGAEVLKEIDALTAGQSGDQNMEAEARLEAAVVARRSSASPQVSDDEIETMIAARRATRKGKSGGFCSKCGRPLLTSDKFCPHCGKVVS